MVMDSFHCNPQIRVRRAPRTSQLFEHFQVLPRRVCHAHLLRECAVVAPQHVQVFRDLHQQLQPALRMCDEVGLECSSRCDMPVDVGWQLGTALHADVVLKDAAGRTAQPDGGSLLGPKIATPAGWRWRRPRETGDLPSATIDSRGLLFRGTVRAAIREREPLRMTSSTRRVVRCLLCGSSRHRRSRPRPLWPSDLGDASGSSRPQPWMASVNRVDGDITH